MIRHALAATALLAATPLAAQSTTQDELDARYDRALAAGYKALFLCSALSGDAAHLRRSESSVNDYELSGIQEPLNSIVPELTHSIARGSDGGLDYVAVPWADDMSPRVAAYRQGKGCALLPIGAALPDSEAARSTLIDRVGDPNVYPLRDAIAPATTRAAEAALGEDYGEGTRTTAVMVR
ncbi:MAG TPA: serine hydrolase, partial [Erythrobacter sp.]|nr:serine hydrolase [Erythrobacter sp.]